MQHARIGWLHCNCAASALMGFYFLFLIQVDLGVSPELYGYTKSAIADYPTADGFSQMCGPELSG